MLDRAVSLYESVELLVQSAKYEEAMILGRPIFEESLMLQWLSEQEEPRRTAYVTWFDHDSWHDYAESLGQVRPNELPGSVESVVKHAKWRRDVAATFAIEHSLKRVKFPSANDLARTHLGRGSESVAFAISQQFVHGRALPASSRQTYLEVGTMVVGTRPEADTTLLPLVVEWTTSSVLHSYSAVAKMLGWNVPTGMGHVRTDLHAP